VFLNPNRDQCGHFSIKVQSVVSILFVAAIYGDMLTTWAALERGAVEVNHGLHPYINPAFLQSHAPWVWYLLMVAFMVLALWISRSLSTVYKCGIGVALLVVPIIIEWNAVVVNLGNIL
jgi:hypothetical protein